MTNGPVGSVMQLSLGQYGAVDDDDFIWSRVRRWRARPDTRNGADPAELTCGS
ncbi:hypothetical protein Asi03nite_09770 [Actinoplanes siamensis]|uniref:Uncharacterized protein n=1 Tax=Actinoplanes siamensis TaxID=1223317 RepID=A0A919KB94_9ACTN|nr:hypothetical protein Asi03nite_09770 [Actinoplanes siamensis]